MTPPRQLPWLQPGQPFPPSAEAWGGADPIPGLLAAGGSLDVDSLLRAYASGIFPWFSDDQPILWWSPDPRMVLQTAQFKLHTNLRKALRQGLRTGELEFRIDHDFAAVIEACASTHRPGQRGTWIVPDMVDAYIGLHRAGHAHSMETWFRGELVGGLYGVGIGRMVFGESMFSHRDNASKMALAALVACCRAWGVAAIDCQQNTGHLASLGAAEMPRADFLACVQQGIAQPPPAWKFNPLYWNGFLFNSPPPPNP
jgi:leucyl/phenylalanyl-tRNA---protein transferase